MSQVSKLTEGNITKIKDPNIKKEYATIVQRINEKIAEMNANMAGLTKEEWASMSPEERDEFMRANARRRAANRR
ncbi:MAG: hypothetical protein LBB11_02405 [Puniceicoccales bacterium]|nr:hypothetical protein [Puniceicoccales bacterium]